MTPVARVLLGGALVLGAVAMYQVKYQVAASHDRRGELATRLAAERNAIHVLRAEWAYLNEPARLAALSEKYLDLVPLEPDQIIDVADLPLADTSFQAAEASQ